MNRRDKPNLLLLNLSTADLRAHSSAWNHENIIYSTKSQFILLPGNPKVLSPHRCQRPSRHWACVSPKIPKDEEHKSLVMLVMKKYLANIFQEFVSPYQLEKPLYKWRSLFSCLISSTVGQGTWSASSAVSEHTTGKERIQMYHKVSHSMYLKHGVLDFQCPLQNGCRLEHHQHLRK